MLLLVFCLHVILINEFKTFENIVKFLNAPSSFLYFVFIKLIRFCVLVAFCLNSTLILIYNIIKIILILDLSII